MQHSSGKPPVSIQTHKHTQRFLFLPPSWSLPSFFSSLPFYPSIPSLSSFLSGSSEDTGKSSLSAERPLSLIRPDLGHRVQGVTMTTSIPGYPSGGKDQLKGTVISLRHTVCILSSRPCTNTILWEGGGGGKRKKYQGFIFFKVPSLWGRTTDCSQRETIYF